MYYLKALLWSIVLNENLSTLLRLSSVVRSIMKSTLHLRHIFLSDHCSLKTLTSSLSEWFALRLTSVYGFLGVVLKVVDRDHIVDALLLSILLVIAGFHLQSKIQFFEFKSALKWFKWFKWFSLHSKCVQFIIISNALFNMFWNNSHSNKENTEMVSHSIFFY